MSSLKLSAVSNLELSAINADTVSSIDDFCAKGNSFLIEASYKTNDNSYKSVKLELSNLLNIIVKNFIMLSCETRSWVPGNGTGTYTITPNTNLSIAVPGNITLSASGTSNLDNNAITLKSNNNFVAVENTRDNKIQCCATSALWN